MVLRSTRLEQIFGISLELIDAGRIRSLVRDSVSEGFDLDFKRRLYGRTESERHDLATDVAALANTAGGIIVLGVDEDEHASAAAAPGVELSDDEERRMLQVIADRVAPVPTFEIRPVPDTPGRGFYLLSVERTAAAPHAVLVNRALRYPVRNGTTTRYLVEPEVAEAYQRRLAGLAERTERLDAVWRDGLSRMDTSDRCWVALALVPDVPGSRALHQQAFRDFDQWARSTTPIVVPIAVSILRTAVGPGRLSADGGGSRGNTRLAQYLTYDLHMDGSGFMAMECGSVYSPSGSAADHCLLVEDEYLTLGVLSALTFLARAARTSSAVSGRAAVRASVLNPTASLPARIGHRRQGFADIYEGVPPLEEAPAPVGSYSDVDTLATPGAALASTTARLCHQLGQAFGLPELGQLTAEGEVRQRYWRNPQLISWAESHSISVIAESLP
jgi:hypothetical protein